MSDFVFWDELKKKVDKETLRLGGEIMRGVGVPEGSTLDKEYWLRVGQLKALGAIMEMGQHVVSDMISQEKTTQVVLRGYDA